VTGSVMNGTTSNAPIEIDDASTVNSHRGSNAGRRTSGIESLHLHCSQNSESFYTRQEGRDSHWMEEFRPILLSPSTHGGSNQSSVGVLKKQGQEKLADLLAHLILTFEKSTEAYEASGKRQGRLSLIPDRVKKLKKVMAMCKDHYETQSPKATVASSAGPGKLCLPKKTDAYGKTWQQTHSGFDPVEGACNPCCPTCRLLTTKNDVSIATKENTQNAACSGACRLGCSRRSKIC